MEEFDELKVLLRFTDQDVRQLRRVGELLTDRLQELDRYLMDWTGPVAMTSVVRQADGTVDEAYLERAHARLVHGFVDTCTRDFDQAWLDYQHEVGLRHHRTKKNQADGAHGVVPHIPFRWIVAFLYPFTQAIRPLLDTTDASRRSARRCCRPGPRRSPCRSPSTAAPTSPKPTGSAAVARVRPSSVPECPVRGPPDSQWCPRLGWGR
jgi:hypothetical protein